MRKILAIGNSFSEDATTYLHAIAADAGIDTKIVNLYIGGCSLATHWANVEADAASYVYMLNGTATDRRVSIREALCEDTWDVITFQQASYDSGLADSYFPYLSDLSAYVRQLAPQAQQWMHQTWAYETGSTHPGFAAYGNDSDAMYAGIKAAYAQAAESIGAPCIPCGTVIQTLRGLPLFDTANGGQSLCRDGFHMGWVYGRYAVAATWCQTLLGSDIRRNGFVPDGGDVPADETLLACIRDTVAAVCGD